MRKILTSICLLIFINLLSEAQDRQFIVKMNGDTIYGKVQINPVRDNSQSMYFKGEDGFKGNIRPLRTNYVFYSPEYKFRSVPLINQRVFMNIISERENISLYHYIHQRDNSIVTSKVVIKPNGEPLELSVLTFKSQMKEFLRDCPGVVAKLDTKQYRFKDHLELFEAYDQCLDEDTPKPPVSNPNPVVAVAPQTTSQPAPGPDKMQSQKDRISKLEAFRSYVKGLQNFQFTKDVMDLLVDIENRINQYSEIPAYLWGSLDAMVVDHKELKTKADQLKLALQK